MIIYFVIEQTGFVIIIGMFLLPILLFYGIPASIFSDYVTKKFKGMYRGFLALLVHLFLACLFVLIPIIFSEEEREILFSDFKNSFTYFFLITSILSSSIFWCIDEFLKSKRVKDIGEKIGDLKI